MHRCRTVIVLGYRCRESVELTDTLTPGFRLGSSGGAPP
jgi:hypothetical protein